MCSEAIGEEADIRTSDPHVERAREAGLDVQVSDDGTHYVLRDSRTGRVLCRSARNPEEAS